MQPSEFASWLRQKMETKGISQADLAKELKLTQGAVSRWFSGSIPRNRIRAQLELYFDNSSETQFRDAALEPLAWTDIDMAPAPEFATQTLFRQFSGIPIRVASAEMSPVIAPNDIIYLSDVAVVDGSVGLFRIRAYGLAIRIVHFAPTGFRLTALNPSFQTLEIKISDVEWTRAVIGAIFASRLVSS